MNGRQVVVTMTLGAAAVLAVVGLYGLFEAVSAGPGRRPPEQWEVPGDYRGLIVAHFGVKGCPTTTHRDGKLVYVVGADGEVCTSDLLLEGVATDSFVYVYPDGRRRVLRQPDEAAKLTVAGGVDPDQRSDLYIFVGTPDEQRHARDTLRPTPRPAP